MNKYIGFGFMNPLRPQRGPNTLRRYGLYGQNGSWGSISKADRRSPIARSENFPAAQKPGHGVKIAGRSDSKTCMFEIRITIKAHQPAHTNPKVKLRTSKHTFLWQLVVELYQHVLKVHLYWEFHSMSIRSSHYLLICVVVKNI